MKRYFIAGGAGFIGSTITKYLLKNTEDEVVVYDNLSSGKTEYLGGKLEDALNVINRLIFIEGDIEDFATLKAAMNGSDIVIHLASNPDIAKALLDPTIDFWQGTFLTQCVLEAMRVTGVKKILYASGSGMYGENRNVSFAENYSPLQPISTYGASKLAGEALICSYCNMFDMTGRSFRFANVVGKNQTHGVAYDFIKKLKADPKHLEIWGNGAQTKSYIYVEDVLDAIFMIDKQCKLKYDVFNVATNDRLTVNFIAGMVKTEMGLDPEITYTGGDRGFKGDVPNITMNSSKIRDLYGWNNKHTSGQAMQKSVKEMLETYT